MTKLNLDYEVKSATDLRVYGLDKYSACPTTRIILCSYSFDNNPNPKLWDINDGNKFPAEVREAMLDPHVIKSAFNAQFERVITRRVAKIKTPYKNWQCSMVRAYLLSFIGSLDTIGEQMGLPMDKTKNKDGLKLIKTFCMPQKVTKNQPHLWRNAETDPELWQQFREYCRQDVVAEMAVEKRCLPYVIPADEWALYELDQRINDRGIPIDMQFVENAIWMAAQRKKELLEQLNEITGLRNSNSATQMLPWLKARGYPFDDIQKDTVTKVLKEADEDTDPIVLTALKIRRQATRTSVAKYTTIKKLIGSDDRLRFMFQFAGASRTARWAGRKVQVHNLPRTPKLIEDHWKLEYTTALIHAGDYDMLGLMVGEHMDALVGCLRSAIRAPEGMQLRVSDLSSIETCVIAWLAGCERLLKVIRSGKDPYKDFAVILYRKVYAEIGTPEYEEAYESITKAERNNCKPPVLGAGYRLGGGKLMEGKRTGLWGYAEAMGIDLSQNESIDAVAAYREGYFEVPQLWYDIEKAVEQCLGSGRTQTVNGLLQFNYVKPFLVVTLPSGRNLYYYKPAMVEKEMISERTGKPYTRRSITYMGQHQKSKKWTRLDSHGGKLVENFVQAIARDVLKFGMFETDAEGFNLIGTVHDEEIALQAIDDKEHTDKLLGDCMTRPLHWAPGLPLGFGSWQGDFYKKD